MVSKPKSLLLVVLTIVSCRAHRGESADRESDYYRLITIAASESPTASRSKQWRPAPGGLALEVSGLEVMDNRRVAVAIRKGEVWILDGVYEDPPSNVKYTQFATALHEPWK